MRTLSTAGLAATSSARIVIVWLIEMELADGTIYLSSGNDLEYAGQLWLGASHVGTIADVEDSSTQRQALRFSLRGVAPDELAFAMQDSARGRIVKIREALCNGETWQVLDAPEIWSGTMDQLSGQIGSGAGTVSASAEHRGTTYARAKALRYTDGDQQRLHPGDQSLQFVVSQANHLDIWPAAAFFKE